MKGKAGTTSSAYAGKVVVIEDVALSRRPVHVLMLRENRFQVLLQCLYAIETEFSLRGTTERRNACALERYKNRPEFPNHRQNMPRLGGKVMIRQWSPPTEIDPFFRTTFPGRRSLRSHKSDRAYLSVTSPRKWSANASSGLFLPFTQVGQVLTYLWAALGTGAVVFRLWGH